ncbi:ABC transporter ATP-binding protein [Martelella soudanensis]|uniref:ABC transporter ATP-binding protein n=1 Tax=unclassified Martelella TaxID=2629616 RepID=UPI0015DE7CB4|nr:MULTISPECIES: oligopeptide/dipeptide ABC transporter ATP-binding protein [unclassified Martelella]
MMEQTPSSPRYILEIARTTKHFPVSGGGFGRPPKTVQAVSDVSFRIPEGTTLGIVGESGCGKSTTARLIMGLIDMDQGDILYNDRPVGRSAAETKAFRRQVQMVFQDSSASLNPRLTIEASIMFGPLVHGEAADKARRHAYELLERVGLDPARFAGRYPHELSGGQRQRVNIARALALGPKVVIFDESVSALDKSIEAQVLNLLIDLKRELNLTYIFISHDLNVVRYISDNVMVMYLGKVVEYGPSETLFAGSSHPYTRALLASMPSLDPENRTQAAPVSGDPPSPIDPPAACRFHPRCALARPTCSSTAPELYEAGEEHVAACHRNDAQSPYWVEGEPA